MRYQDRFKLTTDDLLNVTQEKLDHLEDLLTRHETGGFYGMTAYEREVVYYLLTQEKSLPSKDYVRSPEFQSILLHTTLYSLHKATVAPTASRLVASRLQTYLAANPLFAAALSPTTKCWYITDRLTMEKGSHSFKGVYSKPKENPGWADCYVLHVLANRLDWPLGFQGLFASWCNSLSFSGGLSQPAFSFLLMWATTGLLFSKIPKEEKEDIYQFFFDGTQKYMALSTVLLVELIEYRYFDRQVSV